MPGPQVPVSTLRRRPRERLRMTQGRCGSLLHIRMTFAFTTPRRFNRRTRRKAMKRSSTGSKHHAGRRTFLKDGVLAVRAATIGAGLLGSAVSALGEEGSGRLTPGDAAILRFLAAAQIIETNLWQHYAQLEGG